MQRVLWRQLQQCKRIDMLTLQLWVVQRSECIGMPGMWRGLVQRWERVVVQRVLWRQLQQCKCIDMYAVQLWVVQRGERVDVRRLCRRAV